MRQRKWTFTCWTYIFSWIYIFIWNTLKRINWFEQKYNFAVNPSRPRQTGSHFSDDIFKCIFLNKNIWILIIILLNFVPKGPINNIPALVQITAWRCSGDEPLSESMMVRSLMHICFTQHQWVNALENFFSINWSFNEAKDGTTNTNKVELHLPCTNPRGDGVIFATTPVSEMENFVILAKL